MPKTTPVLSRTCRACGDDYITENRSARYCRDCMNALSSWQRSNLVHFPWKLELFRYRYFTTGERKMVYDTPEVKAEYEEFIGQYNHKDHREHLATECLPGCKYLSKCGDDPCCMYILLEGHSRPKEAGYVGRDCKCYEPTSAEYEKYKRALRLF